MRRRSRIVPRRGFETLVIVQCQADGPLVVATDPDSSGATAVNQNHVISSIRKTRMVFLTLQVKLPAQKDFFLPFGPLGLCEFFFARARVQGKQELIVLFSNWTQFDRAAIRQRKCFCVTHAARL